MPSRLHFEGREIDPESFLRITTTPGVHRGDHVEVQIKAEVIRWRFALVLARQALDLFYVGARALVVAGKVAIGR